MSEKRKIFPRNATAHSHSWVVGNPVTSRPESGVDNSYPGLEFDQRNLDKRFFPGMEFEFHSSAVLRSINDNLDSNITNVILEQELDAGLVLLAVNGSFGDELNGSRNRTASFNKTGGLNDWRIIHDLEEGPLAIALIPLSEQIQREDSVFAFRNYLNSGNEEPFVERNEVGQLMHIFVRGNRARYLNENGVIDPAEYSPGELTRSLCSPWQYDFALCGCFYWASNKPDMVKRDTDSAQLTNFQRSKSQGEPPVEPITDYARWEGNLANNISEHEMISDWEQLPAVFDAIEGRGVDIGNTVVLSDNDILDRNAVIAALMDLATVEHGLMIEYLYAYYSLDTQAFDDGSDARARVSSAAVTVLSIAIDEMRHLRWVNEMLLLLGAIPELGRFDEMPDTHSDGRGIKHTFSLESLTPDRLQWFITVEAPSDHFDVQGAANTIDGMYTWLLLSISQGNEFTEEEEKRLLHRIKLVIDEGHDHYLRFLRVQELLSELDPNAYLRLQSNPTPLPTSAVAHVFERLVDTSYAAVLDLLKRLFVPNNSGRIDSLVIGARELMYNLDEAAQIASANGGSPLFTLPSVSGLGIVAENMIRVEDEGLTLSQFIDQELIPNFENNMSSALDKLPDGQKIANNMRMRLQSARDQVQSIE